MTNWLRFPRLLGVICGLYFLVMTVVFGNLTAENREFSATARETTGTVVALVSKPMPGGRIVRHRDMALAPMVQFSADGVRYSYTPARGRRHQPVRVGQTVTVLYDATDPKATARIKGEGSIALPLITMGFLVTAVGLAVLLVRTRPRRRPVAPARPARPARPDRPVPAARARH